MSWEAVEKRLASQSDRFEHDLFSWLRIPSVSADSAYAERVRDAGRWAHDKLQAMGLKTEWIETAGHPIVYAERLGKPGAPTALIYGHYDVQPPDPLDEWISPPFEPTVRNGNLHARGATDDKGQLLTHILGVESWLAETGDLPINVKFLIEGEEEVGSEHVEAYVANNGEKLACDCVVISDTSQFGPGRPAITFGLRGMSYHELHLRGPKQDLHSGVFGGSVKNPANALAELLSGLIDSRGRIRLAGFYDDVAPLSDLERKTLAELPFDEADYARRLELKELFGEEGYTTLERRWARPTFDINGIWGGYQGEGAKTVLPAKAGAKFSFRLVPNQDPLKIAAALERHLRERLPPGIEMTLKHYHGAPAAVVPLDSPYLAAAQRAIHAGFGVPPVFIREGGSIPIVSTFKELLGADTLLMGWGLDDDNTHSPNEKFHLADFHRGIKSSARLWQELSSV